MEHVNIYIYSKETGRGKGSLTTFAEVNTTTDTNVAPGTNEVP